MRLLNRKGNSARFGIDIFDVNINLLSDFENFRRVTDALPGNVGNVRKSVDAANINERAVIDETLNRALKNIANMQRTEDFLLFNFAFTLKETTTAQYKTAFMRLYFNRQSLNRLPDVTTQIFDEMQFHLRRRNKSTQSVYRSSQTALDNAVNRGVNRFQIVGVGIVVMRLNRTQFIPNDFGICFDFGKDAAIFAAERLNVNFNLVALLDNVFCRIRLRISEFLFRNSNFLLVTYVDVGLFAID